MSMGHRVRIGQRHSRGGLPNKPSQIKTGGLTQNGFPKRASLCTLPPELAERAGFEPAEPYGSRALQARALGRTTLPLRAYYGADYTIRWRGWQEPALHEIYSPSSPL
jgi:hypothetical protein